MAAKNPMYAQLYMSSVKLGSSNGGELISLPHEVTNLDLQIPPPGAYSFDLEHKVIEDLQRALERQAAEGAERDQAADRKKKEDEDAAAEAKRAEEKAASFASSSTFAAAAVAAVDGSTGSEVAGLLPEQARAVQRMTQIAGVDDEKAIVFLRKYDWDVKRAVQAFYG